MHASKRIAVGVVCAFLSFPALGTDHIYQVYLTGFCQNAFNPDFAPQFKKLKSDSYYDSLQMDWDSALAAASHGWGSESDRIVSLVKTGALNFSNDNHPYHTTYDGAYKDLVKIREHIGTAIFVARNDDEARAIAGMIYYLHLIDDILDHEHLSNGRSLSTLDIHWHNVAAAVLGEDTDYREELERDHRNLYTLGYYTSQLFNGRFAKQPTLRKQNYIGLLDAMTLLIAAGRPYEVGNDDDRYQVLDRMKQYVYSGLSEPLQRRLGLFSPSTMLLMAKAPMGAVMALEGQPYDADRAALWSLLFGPFFYDFSKVRPRHMDISGVEMSELIMWAAKSLSVRADKNGQRRVVQLRYMMENWPNTFPDRVKKSYHYALEILEDS